MKLKYVLAMLLLVATLSNLTTDDGTTPPPASPEDEVASTLRTNVNKALSTLQTYGSGSTSLSLIKFYLGNINKCLDDVLSLHNINAGEAASLSNMIVIANKELSALTDDSKQMDLDFLVMTTPTSLIRQLLLGAYQINLSNVDALTKDPDSVIQKLNDTDAFQAAKNLFLNTPKESRILC